MTSAAIVSLRVAASPERAFDAFTRDIGAWWRADQFFALTPRGDGEMFFEPGPDGRLATRLASGKIYEIGRILKWAPPHLLAFQWRPATFAPEQMTEVEVRFEAVDNGARITIEHRAWDAIAQSHVARHSFELIAFQRRLALFWRAGLSSMAEQISDGGR
ncbi:MAG: SRPBCC domain-containing protein [Parvularculaceae bacterium]